VPLELKVHRVPKVYKGKPDLKAKRVHKVNRANKAFREYREFRANPVNKVKPDPKGNKVYKANRVLRETPALSPLRYLSHIIPALKLSPFQLLVRLKASISWSLTML
jgi:hypothetical protein